MLSHTPRPINSCFLALHTRSLTLSPLCYVFTAHTVHELFTLSSLSSSHVRHIRGLRKSCQKCRPPDKCLYKLEPSSREYKPTNSVKIDKFILLNAWLTQMTGRAMDWAVNRQSVTTGPGFAPGSLRTGFTVDKVALRQVFLPSSSVFPVNIIPPFVSILISPGGWTTRSSSETEYQPINMINNNGDVLGYCVVFSHRRLPSYRSWENL
jgi:hypothetical protein